MRPKLNGVHFLYESVSRRAFKISQCAAATDDNIVRRLCTAISDDACDDCSHDRLRSRGCVTDDQMTKRALAVGPAESNTNSLRLDNAGTRAFRSCQIDPQRVHPTLHGIQLIQPHISISATRVMVNLCSAVVRCAMDTELRTGNAVQ